MSHSRTQWKQHKIISLVNCLVDNHEIYKQEKKNLSLEVFYTTIAEQYNCTCQQLRDLLKNLGKEYRQVLQNRTNVSASSDTKEETLQLRDSKELFNVFSRYYSIYYSKGTTQQQDYIVTPTKVKRTYHDLTQPDTSASSSESRPMSTEYTPKPCRPASNVYRSTVTEQGSMEAESHSGEQPQQRKRKKKSNDGSQDPYIDLMKEQNHLLANLVNEISFFRQIYCQVNSKQLSTTVPENNVQSPDSPSTITIKMEPPDDE
ncbi:hypothetical protein SNE40_018572 [Patella caerulea]|uniref:Uncharacterized protein n=1 Tax=Patella caerulea TaxID=87958 RepID=A0AAN8J5S6_PATCE